MRGANLIEKDRRHGGSWILCLRPFFFPSKSHSNPPNFQDFNFSCPKSSDKVSFPLSEYSNDLFCSLCVHCPDEANLGIRCGPGPFHRLIGSQWFFSLLNGVPEPRWGFWTIKYVTLSLRVGDGSSICKLLRAVGGFQKCAVMWLIGPWRRGACVLRRVRDVPCPCLGSE